MAEQKKESASVENFKLMLTKENITQLNKSRLEPNKINLRDNIREVTVEGKQAVVRELIGSGGTKEVYAEKPESKYFRSRRLEFSVEGSQQTN